MNEEISHSWRTINEWPWLGQDKTKKNQVIVVFVWKLNDQKWVKLIIESENKVAWSDQAVGKT